MTDSPDNTSLPVFDEKENTTPNGFQPSQTYMFPLSHGAPGQYGYSPAMLTNVSQRVVLVDAAGNIIDPENTRYKVIR